MTCNFDWVLFLEYLKVVLSWPVVAALFAWIMLRLFRKEIGGWLQHLAIRRGETELYSKQPPAPAEASALEGLATAPAKSPETVIPSPVTPPDLTHAASPSPSMTEPTDSLSTLREENQELKRSAQALRNIAKHWEFNYFSLFLVPHTKTVLAWLSKAGPTAVSTYHSAWASNIPNVREREAVLQALSTTSLVQEKDGQLLVTDKGKEYVNWANLTALLTVPPPPPPSFPTIG